MLALARAPPKDEKENQQRLMRIRRVLSHAYWSTYHSTHDKTEPTCNQIRNNILQIRRDTDHNLQKYLSNTLAGMQASASQLFSFLFSPFFEDFSAAQPFLLLQANNQLVYNFRS